MRDAVEAVRRDDHNVDDAAGIFVVAPVLCGGLHHVPSAVQIGIDDGIPALYGKIDSRLRKLPARAVDEAVDAVMRLPDRIEQSFDRIGILNIGCVCGCLQLPSCQVRYESIEPFLVAANQDDMCAEPCEQPRGGAPDPPGSAG